MAVHDTIKVVISYLWWKNLEKQSWSWRPAVWKKLTLPQVLFTIFNCIIEQDFAERILF